VREMFGLNLALAALAAISIKTASPEANFALIALGAAAVAVVMLRFSREVKRF
jgi:predicted Zn-dependent protease